MNVSKTKLLEMTKAKMMDYYNELTPTQQEQFKDFPQQKQQRGDRDNSSNLLVSSTKQF